LQPSVSFPSFFHPPQSKPTRSRQSPPKS
jgi:hypothetical protein